MRHRSFTVAFGIVPVLAALVSLAYIGTEFMPRLDEGSLLIETRKLPGISLTESVALSSASREGRARVPGGTKRRH